MITFVHVVFNAGLLHSTENCWEVNVYGHEHVFLLGIMGWPSVEEEDGLKSSVTVYDFCHTFLIA